MHCCRYSCCNVYFYKFIPPPINVEVEGIKMDYKKSTIKVFEYVNKVKDMKRKKKPSSVPVQKIRLDEQTRNDFELEHDTKLKDPYIYLDPDDSFRNSRSEYIGMFFKKVKRHTSRFVEIKEHFYAVFSCFIYKLFKIFSACFITL